VSYGGYTVTASTPPMAPRNLSDLDVHNVQVDMNQASSNGLATVIGFAQSHESSHSVARHMNGGTAVGFALFSNTYISSGNNAETVVGNVYTKQYIRPQSSGQAIFCTDRTSSTADDGYIILGEPQTAGPPAQGEYSVTPANWPFLATPSGGCASVTANGVYQAGALVQQHQCPTINGVPDSLSYNAQLNACVSLPITPPVAAPPPQSGNVFQVQQTPCSGNGNGNGGGGKGGTGNTVPSCWNSNFTPTSGMYVVHHNPNCDPSAGCWDLLLTQPFGSATQSPPLDITFWLAAGANMGVNIGGSGGNIVINGPYDAGTGQANDGKFVVYGEGSSSFHVNGAKTTVEFQHGSIYMPGGLVQGGSSTAGLLVDDGQAVADTWDISSGNHPNPQINYDGGFAPVSTEALRLVE
jgi:hypothetical protein